jgi:hypothetical protein
VKGTLCYVKIKRLKIQILRYVKKPVTLSAIERGNIKDINKYLFTTQESRWPENVKLSMKTSCYNG